MAESQSHIDSFRRNEILKYFARINTLFASDSFHSYLSWCMGERALHRSQLQNRSLIHKYRSVTTFRFVIDWTETARRNLHRFSVYPFQSNGLLVVSCWCRRHLQSQFNPSVLQLVPYHSNCFSFCSALQECFSLVNNQLVGRGHEYRDYLRGPSICNHFGAPNLWFIIGKNNCANTQGNIGRLNTEVNGKVL